MHKVIKLYGLLLFMLCIIHTSNAQDVSISRDISVRSEYSYDLLHLKNKAMLFRNRGDEFYMDVFDKDLKYKRSVQLNPEDNKIFIECIHTIDSFINVYYSFKEKDKWVIKAKRLNDELVETDTVVILSSTKPLEIGELRYKLSEDKSKLLLFSITKDKVHQLLFDTRSFTLIHEGEYQFEEYKLREDFIEVSVTNLGHAFYLFEKNNDGWGVEKHGMSLMSINLGGQFAITIIDQKLTVNSGVKMEVDNKNQRLGIAGLWGPKSITETNGYFVVNKSIAEIFQSPIIEITKVEYDVKINIDLDGVERKNKKNNIFDFYLKQVLFRNDGGLILVAEFERELSRRSNNGPTFDRNNLFSQGLRGYTDYYNEDMLVFSTQIDGSQYWRKVLFKKQFSQDDEAIYSSFFIMKLPSQLHIMYNDEIKNNNTVSEYLVDPLGNVNRNSILSTEYKNLKLRFGDAIQVSASEILVPSEKNGKINIVKINL